MKFELVSKYHPAGDQQDAIDKLTLNLKRRVKNQVLLGVTGSGKTFTIANTIKNTQLPTLVISHNKTLAAQLFQEFREFFPKNAVEYFVSYYDYYQPESYIPQTDTYIEKDADINEEIDRFRLATTASLLTRKDVVVISSVSSIYNIGSPVEYANTALEVRIGMKILIESLIKRLVQLLYERNDFDFKRGSFRVRGERVDVYPAYADYGISFEVKENTLTQISKFDAVSGKTLNIEEGLVNIFSAKHYVTPENRKDTALKKIEADLRERVTELKEQKKEMDAYRLEQRTNYDLEMIREIGYCKGIENYSLYFDERKSGEPPYTLVDYYNWRFKNDWLLVIDESHITVPQIRGMYNGDQSRKKTLVDFGFRLPSALDNRPLRFDEFLAKVKTSIFASATPSPWEISFSGKENVVEQLVRPTGLVDPKITIQKTDNQIEDLVKRILEKTAEKERVLVTTLTKKMAERLSEYLADKKIKVTYLHSDIKTLERTDILDNLRKGEFDVLVGINLLREGLDLPEVSLVAILDADKEGFLRSETSLIQTMGRAARHINGEVVMYADTVTTSMKKAIMEVERRRKIQEEFNKKHNITPQSIRKDIRQKMFTEDPVEEKTIKDIFFVEDYEFRTLPAREQKKMLKELENKMRELAEFLEFEKAAKIRDKIRQLKNI
ncbi:MAG: excinuclease ABC subunit UvrB [Patescibacteria group bacterium]